MKAVFQLFKETFSEWGNDKALRLGAALAYYSVFAIGPVVLLVVGAAGTLFGALYLGRAGVTSGSARVVRSC
jgi:membrane protein